MVLKVVKEAKELLVEQVIQYLQDHKVKVVSKVFMVFMDLKDL